MDKNLPRLIVMDGTGQEERSYAAHRESYFQVDERGFAELLALATDHAGLVLFFDLLDRPDGTWSDYFKSDESVLVALVQTARLDGLQAEFDALLDRLAAFPKLGAMHDPRKTPPYRLAKMLDQWHMQLKSAGTPAGKELGALIETLIKTRLRASMADLRRSLAAGGAFEQADFASEFDPVWFDAQSETSAAAELPDDRDLKSLLVHLFGEVLGAAEFIRANAARLLPAVVENSAHDPGAGLLLVFLRLFDKAQRQANRFSQRHLDFYHDAVLRVRPLGSEADGAFLVFRPNVQGTEILVEKGAEFLLGKDSQKRDRVGRADSDLFVNDASVVALHTLHFGGSLPGVPASRSPGESADIYGRSRSRALLRRLPHEENPGLAANEGPACPLFGASRRGAMDGACAQARIGFAVASKVLALREGRRTIEIAFKLGEPDEEDPGGLKERLVALAAAESRGAREVFVQDIFIKSFRDIFKIGVTAAQGWLEMPDYIPLHAIVDETCPKNALIFRMELARDGDAIIPYRRELHGEDYAADCPVLRFVVNRDAYLNPYGLLRDLPLKACELRVEADECRDLRLANHLGALSPEAPFHPFGPIPATGAYFIVGSPEAASKKLTRFHLNVEWSGLPAGPGGFKDYYRNYGVELDNEDFKAGLSVLAEGKWQPALRPEIPLLGLFAEEPSETGEKSLASANTLVFDPALPYCKALDAAVANAEWSYRTDARAGFFKLTLLQPKFGFGHADYQSALTEALIFNARVKVERLRKPIPPPPCAPTINAVSFGYGAVARIDLNEAAGSARTERFFHLHPLGWEFMPKDVPGKTTLIPYVGEAGNLFLGLRGGETAKTLSLLFHLRDDSNPDYRATADRPRWQYLSNDGWKNFEARRIVSDSTRGFQTTGIVQFDLPSDLGRDHPLMPKGLAWLRASAKRGLDGYCSLVSVHAQALRVTRGGEPDPSDQLEMPPGTPARARKTLPGIRSIAFIAASRGGRDAETRPQMRTRVSERAKHRNRAILPWDYERLILERFPAIGKVKCFANMTPALARSERIRPGRILIVALPKASPAWTPWRMPMLSGYVLEDIRELVVPLASPFAKIEVRNPVYERIQVRCTVKLARGYSDGHCLKLIDRALCDYLSPWTAVGYQARFGWRVRRRDIEAHLLSLDSVEAVSGFSMLRIADDGRDDHYRLFDTAAAPADATREEETEADPFAPADATREEETEADPFPADASGDDIEPLYPWSMPIPLRRHYLRTASGLDAEPEAAALGALEIGSTFIISRRTGRWQNKTGKR
jgi:hypothetical protein